MPAYVAAYREQGGTGNVTFTLPTGWAVNDILLLACESNSGEAVATPTGYTALPGSPQEPAGGDTRLTVCWKRAVSGETAPVITDAGDHIAAHMFAIRDAVTTGDPFIASASGTDTVGSTDIFFADITAAAGGDLAIMLACITRDADTNPTINSFSMTNVEFGYTEAAAMSSTQGGGGGVCAVWGLVAAAGTVTGDMNVDTAYKTGSLSYIVQSADAAQTKITKGRAYIVSGTGEESLVVTKGRMYVVVDTDPPPPPPPTVSDAILEATPFIIINDYNVGSISSGYYLLMKRRRYFNYLVGG